MLAKESKGSKSEEMNIEPKTGLKWKPSQDYKQMVAREAKKEIPYKEPPVKFRRPEEPKAQGIIVKAAPSTRPSPSKSPEEQVKPETIAKQMTKAPPPELEETKEAQVVAKPRTKPPPPKLGESKEVPIIAKPAMKVPPANAPKPKAPTFEESIPPPPDEPHPDDVKEAERRLTEEKEKENKEKTESLKNQLKVLEEQAEKMKQAVAKTYN